MWIQKEEDGDERGDSPHDVYWRVATVQMATITYRKQETSSLSDRIMK